MTSKNLSLKNKPFLLKPVGKDYLWGGRRLNDDFSKAIPLQPLAETWECSTHPDGPSMVASGEFKGLSLAEVLHLQPELLGRHYAGLGELPILIKLIDAKKDLSVQVHPDDEYAFQHEQGQRGKTEMWYVLDASRDSQLVYGFSHDINRAALEKSLLDGTVEKYLQKVPVHSDDIFFIKPGTVHAIGAGALIAEIQESSNLTYRLFDYNRVDKNGKKRELHIEKALTVVNMHGSARPKQPLRVLKYRRGYAAEMLCRCKYFQVERILVNTERCRELASFQSNSDSFQVLLCTNGCGIMTFGDGEVLQLFRGDCVFLPADSVEVKVHGELQLLLVRG
ncbi:type I phosphomannose isomerase catalytic subunit [uncultured Phascolarctobacterium sp.]|uniref:type I phosphomannose isomerase catalytic subunit n=1 Tax=uncultured Phascolarctobacterium sp. TaxID=512296 RepID=UPI0025EE452D|nr:type I phosphomannose isomerase catalytic subunit [uncultured Phascolarctobacterium sp.]